MSQVRTELLRENNNTEKKIEIVQSMIGFYKTKIQSSSGLGIRNFVRSLDREELNLKELKNKYPEFFI